MALALAAHGVFAFGVLNLARSSEQRAPAPTSALVLLPVDLETPAQGATGDSAALALAERSTPRFSRDPLGDARARLRSQRAAVARRDPRTGELDARSTGALPVPTSAGSAGASPSAALSSAGSSEQTGAGDHSPGRDRGIAAASTGAQATAHGPRLRVRKPCRGLFPAGANEDVGVVTLALQIGREGDASRARILDERPRGQGFARAALTCVPSLSFEPATRDDGTRTAATSTVRLRFVRHL